MSDGKAANLIVSVALVFLLIAGSFMIGRVSVNEPTLSPVAAYCRGMLDGLNYADYYHINAELMRPEQQQIYEDNCIEITSRGDLLQGARGPLLPVP